MVEAGVPGAVVVGVSTGEEDEVVEVLTEVEAEVSTEVEVEAEVSTEGEVVVVGVSMEVEVEAEDVEDLRGAAVDLREEDTIRVPAALGLCPTWPHQNTRSINDHCQKILHTVYSLIMWSIVILCRKCELCKYLGVSR